MTLKRSFSGRGRLRSHSFDCGGDVDSAESFLLFFVLLRPGRNLVCDPFATSLPSFTVVIVTSMNARYLPILSTLASASTSSNPGPGDM